MAQPRDDSEASAVPESRDPSSSPGPSGSLLPLESTSLVVELGRKLLAAVLDLKDDDGSRAAQPFLDLPDRTLHPKYYEVIPHPICLNDIRRRLSSDEPYETVDEIRAALNKVFCNTHRFDSKTSPMYFAASKLKKLVREAYASLQIRTDTRRAPSLSQSPRPPKRDLLDPAEEPARRPSRRRPTASPVVKKPRIASTLAAPKGYAYLIDSDPEETDRIEELEDEMAELKKQLEDVKRRSDRKDSTIAELQANMALTLSWPAQKSELTRRVSDLEHRSRQDQTKALKENYAVRRSLDTAYFMIATLKSQVDAQATHANSPTIEQKAAVSATNEVTELEAQLMNSEYEMRKESHESSAALAQSLLDLQAKNDELLGQLWDATTAHAMDVDALEAKNSNLRSQIELLRAVAAPVDAPVTPVSVVASPVPAVTSSPAAVRDPKIASDALNSLLDSMLPAYESLYWTLRTLKGKDDDEAKKVVKTQTLLGGFDLLNARLEEKRSG